MKLARFVVGESREMDGAAIAINEQRFAPNIRNVVSADEFGSVVEGNAGDFLKFLPGITVDTHVGRLSRRMGLTTATDPEKVEQDLMNLIPKKEWTMFSHRMIFHGRQVCFARKPNCPGCGLIKLCPKIGVDGT